MCNGNSLGSERIVATLPDLLKRGLPVPVTLLIGE